MDMPVTLNDGECGYNLSKMQDTVKSFLIRDLLGIGANDGQSATNGSDNLKGNRV